LIISGSPIICFAEMDMRLVLGQRTIGNKVS